MEAAKKEEKEDLKGLFDLIIPLSMPVSVIRQMVENFELDLIRREAKMDMTGEVMDREVLVLRGDLETVMEAKKFMFQALDKKIEEWEKGERSEKYRKLYEDQLRQGAQEQEMKAAEQGKNSKGPEQSS